MTDTPISICDWCGLHHYHVQKLIGRLGRRVVIQCERCDGHTHIRWNPALGICPGCSECEERDDLFEHNGFKG